MRRGSVIQLTSTEANGPARKGSALPSLLRYVDRDLMHARAKHNRPPDEGATCLLCTRAHDGCLEGSTFLPLVPCGCWMHYRCFVNSTGLQRDHGCCPLCHLPLFEWEGVTVLMLLTRTGLTMQDGHLTPAGNYFDEYTNLSVYSDRTAYETDCAHIWNAIDRQFHVQLARESPFEDWSPNLTQCYYDVLLAVDQASLPRGEWLKWKTHTGFLLFGMLVAIKMRRYLVEVQGKIEGTMAWKDFEHGREVLARKISHEVWKAELDG
ncbi:hypothetical protein P280DRAFT_284169 [Massarina eburnea CBS 473.64]|uniref:Uncharacterized protein n=1 Tax=Massarina eburnea CBS 473.64 TaxID=1395130 RepID=A0A6A6S374_9PLEO|nr:hypothetical protein P280DRAFT_284169 [Massarina eburnea CBS 473.64]